MYIHVHVYMYMSMSMCDMTWGHTYIFTRLPSASLGRLHAGLCRRPRPRQKSEATNASSHGTSSWLPVRSSTCPTV